MATVEFNGRLYDDTLRVAYIRKRQQIGGWREGFEQDVKAVFYAFGVEFAWVVDSDRNVVKLIVTDPNNIRHGQIVSELDIK